MNATQQKNAQKAEADRRKREQEAAKLADQKSKKDKEAEDKRAAEEKAKPPAPKKGEQNKAQDSAQVAALKKEIADLKATNAKQAERAKKNREAIIATNEFSPGEVGSDLTACIKKLAAKGKGTEGMSEGDLGENGERRPHDDITAPKPAHGTSAHKRTDGPLPEGGYDDPLDLPADHPTVANPDE
jgi:hypothetical protein